jgi:hypothetical protein
MGVDKKINENLLLEGLKGGDHTKVIGTDGRIIRKWILREWGRRLWTRFMCLRIGTMAGSLEQGNELSSCMKNEFLD